MNYRELDRFTRSYIETALWSITDNADETGGEPLDRNYSPDDIHPETLARMAEDCRAFQEENRADLDACGLSPGRQGHNFWLNRNGHGSGFWDECFDCDAPEYEPLQRLSKASKSWGTFDLYIGDDGMIHGG